MDNNCSKIPINDLKESALSHYDEAALKVSHWMSYIPQSIKFFSSYQELNFIGRLKLAFTFKYNK